MSFDKTSSSEFTHKRNSLSATVQNLNLSKQIDETQKKQQQQNSKKNSTNRFTPLKLSRGSALLQQTSVILAQTHQNEYFNAEHLKSKK